MSRTSVVRTSVSLLGLVICAGLPAGFAQEASPKETAKKDAQTGVVVSEKVSAAKDQKAATCTLIVPASVNGGQTFTFQVNYSPCVTGGRIETFTFAWPSTLAPFAENTVRQKIFFSSTSCISGSFEIAAAPSAGAIKGTANVRVDVRGETFSCSATKTMTVN